MKRPKIECKRNIIMGYGGAECELWYAESEVKKLETYCDQLEKNKAELMNALKFTLDKLREYNVFIPEYAKLLRNMEADK